MNRRLLQWLRCPQCQSVLHLVDDTATAHIADNAVACEHGHRFPVQGGVPRFVPLASARSLTRRTQDAFSYEWRHFADYNVENFWSLVLPLPAAFFTGTLGLDAGCGAGRHLLAATQAGAEMIGLDQSQAVDVLQLKLAPGARAHVVQADLRVPPFAPGIFDFIYSWGVLHHTPDPEASFRALLPLLKPGGLIVIGVYQATWRKWLLEIPRAVTARLPPPFTRGIAWCCAVVDYYGCIVPYRRLAHRLGSRAARWAPSHVREYAQHAFRVSDADWFDRLSAPVTHWCQRADVERWLARSSLRDVRVTAIGDFWWRGEGRAL